MLTTATQNEHDNAHAPVWFMALELREKTWKLGCTTGHGQKPRARPVAARQPARVLQEVAQAQRRCGLPDTASVVSGDEAGRAGFWRHRFWQAQGITSQVVDSSSIAVKRRQRRAKRAGWDVRKVLRMLRRYQHGERQVWQVVHGPAVQAEEQRPRPRDWATLKQERASTTARIQGLLRSQGIRLTRGNTWPEPREAQRRWEEAPMPGGRRRRLLRVDAPHPFRSEQIAEVEAERRALSHLASGRRRAGAAVEAAARHQEQWVVVIGEGIGWREWKTRREGGG